MKTTSLLFLFALPLALAAGEVKRGDTIDQVQATLGAPRGRMQTGARMFLSFDRGEVELSSGVVTRVALRSEEAQTLFETKCAADAARLREELEIRRTKQVAEGEALKATKLADKSFLSAPARIQVEYWRNFAAQYPMVSCTEPLNLARAQLYAQEHIERIAAEEELRLIALKAEEASQRVFYPICSTDSRAYESRYRDQYRLERLDRDYYERIRGSSGATSMSPMREEKDRNSERNRHDWSHEEPAVRDHRHDALFGNQCNDSREVSRRTTANPALLATGQDVMAWDGTKMPGGEAAGSFR